MASNGLRPGQETDLVTNGGHVKSIPNVVVIPKRSALNSSNETELEGSGGDEELLVKERGDRRRGWREYNPLERTLWIALGFVSATAIAFIVGVAVLGLKLNEDEEIGPVTQTPKTTLIPPWLTFAPPTTTGIPPTKRTTTPRPEDWNVCKETSCHIISGKMLEAMDFSVEPCEDFVKFSCGGWDRNHQIPDTYSQWDQFNILLEELTERLKSILQTEKNEITDPPALNQARDFYSSCTKPANKTLDLINLVDSLVNTTESLSSNLASIRLSLGGNYIWTMYVDLDEMDTVNNTIYIDQPDFGIPRPYLVDPNGPNNYTEAYTNLIENIWRVVYGESTDVTEIAKNIVLFESALANISTRPEDRKDKMAMYNAQHISDLYELIGDEEIIDWDEYFELVFQNFNTFELPEETESWNDTMVIVRDVSFFSQLSTILNDPTQEETIRNYLKWRIIFKLANDVSSELRDIVFKFSSVTQGFIKAPSLWKTCVEQTNSFFGMAISIKYVKEYFQDQTDQALEMANDVKASFIQNLFTSEMDWIGSGTKEAAKEKADNMRTNIGYPDWLLSDFTNNPNYTINDYYKNLNLDDPTNHFSNVLNLLEWTSQKQLKEIQETEDAQKWSTVPTIINAFYSDTYNSMTFPAAILQMPLHGMPFQYLNYGAMGSIIGHELIHGFDDTGRQNNADGNLEDWWDAGTLKNYTTKAQCFIDQYANYSIPIGQSDETLPLNGELTLGENIADNGGVNLAFGAYQAFLARNGADEFFIPGMRQYTGNQMFFLSYAQMFCGLYTPASLEMQVRSGTHTPHHFRVRGVLENSLDFATTWGCPKVEDEVCRIW